MLCINLCSTWSALEPQSPQGWQYVEEWDGGRSRPGCSPRPCWTPSTCGTHGRHSRGHCEVWFSKWKKSFVSKKLETEFYNTSQINRYFIFKNYHLSPAARECIALHEAVGVERQQLHTLRQDQLARAAWACTVFPEKEEKIIPSLHTIFIFVCPCHH